MDTDEHGWGARAQRLLMAMLTVTVLLLSVGCRSRGGAETGEVADAAPLVPDAAMEPLEAGAAVESPDDAASMEGSAEGLDDGGPSTADSPPSTVDSGSSTAGSTSPGEPVVPLENREQGVRPGPESAEALARKLLAAIVVDDASIAAEAVFPLAPFEILKDLPKPSAYHRRMVQWFEEDLHTKHAELGGATDLVFERFVFGRCSWQEPHTEGNLLPYWSCRRNRIVTRRGERIVEIEVRVLINWGADWFVAHLGPVRT